MESSQADVLSEFLSAGTESARAVEQGLEAKHRLLLAGASAVPDIESRLASGPWEEKVKCYSLLVEMGNAVVEPLERDLAGKPPTVILWDSAILMGLHRPSGEAALRELLRHRDPHVRYLSALVLAFQQIATPTHAEWLVPNLIDGLHSNASIEGSTFPVAAGSLAMLNLIAGRSFLPDGKSVEIYNLTWMFPPPVLPFPLAAVKLDSTSRAEVIRAVETWWAARSAKNS